MPNRESSVKFGNNSYLQQQREVCVQGLGPWVRETMFPTFPLLGTSPCWTTGQSGPPPLLIGQPNLHTLGTYYTGTSSDILNILINTLGLNFLCKWRAFIEPVSSRNSRNLRGKVLIREVLGQYPDMGCIGSKALNPRMSHLGVWDMPLLAIVANETKGLSQS